MQHRACTEACLFDHLVGGDVTTALDASSPIRRSNGGDWTEGLTGNRLEHSPLRGRYVAGDVFSQREVNDETRSNRYRKRWLFGFHRLVGGGDCTGQYQPERLPG